MVWINIPMKMMAEMLVMMTTPVTIVKHTLIRVCIYSVMIVLRQCFKDYGVDFRTKTVSTIIRQGDFEESRLQLFDAISCFYKRPTGPKYASGT
jgi:hypothetical protein